MKTLSLLSVLVLCASAAVAAVPQAPADTGDQVSASGIAGQVSATDESPRTQVETSPVPLPQALGDPICRADCREDYGACLISTPQSICSALYQTCLANC